MNLKNISPLGSLDIPALGRTVDAGEVVTVDDEDLATRLLEQTDNWEAVKAAPTKKDDR